jgi:putative endonuclease
MYYVYLLRCKDNSLYCGITNDLAAREQAHNSGTGSKYVLSRGGGSVIYSEQYQTKSEALQREAAIKSLSKAEKEKLVGSVVQ